MESALHTALPGDHHHLKTYFQAYHYHWSRLMMRARVAVLQKEVLRLNLRSKFLQWDLDLVGVCTTSTH